MYRGENSVTSQLSSQVPRELRSYQGFGFTPPLSTLAGTPPTSTAGQLQANSIDVLSSNVAYLTSMLQSTQQTLIIQETRTKKLEEELAELREKFTQFESKCASDKSASGTPSRGPHTAKVPNALSVAVRKLHDQTDDDCKFNGSEMYSTAHNQKVADFIFQQIKGQFASTCDDPVIKRGIHRYYESRRRLFNDSRPGRSEKVQVNKKNAQKKAYQRRMYERRKKFLRTDNEIKRWAEVDERYMTEESDSNDGGTVLQHKVPWRSSRLNTLISTLDARAEEASVVGSGKVQLKPRQESVLSAIPPPPNAPAWAVDSSYTESVSPSPPQEDLGGSTEFITPRRQPNEIRNARHMIPLSTSDVLDQLAD